MLGSLEQFDRRGFLGFDVWDFSWRSLARPYGRWFVTRIVLRHPWRTWRGVRRYRRWTRPQRRPDLALVDVESVEDLRDRLQGGKFVVGTGFCQKPIDPPCPAGRFNHRCHQLTQPPGSETPAPCRACPIHELGRHTLEAGGTFHIMTSAADIGRDLLTAALRTSPWQGALLAICPYSIPPFALAMSICGLPGALFGYERGDCRDYASWARADEGDKPDQTFLAVAGHRRLLAILGELTEARGKGRAAMSPAFRQSGNFYVPV